MSGRTRIIGYRPESSAIEAAPDAPASEPPRPAPIEFHDIELDDEGDEVSRSGGGWFLPTLGLLASLGWIGGMLWLAWPSLPAAAPIVLTGFVAALCVPPALIGILLLLALRTSTAEARRFGRTAQAMRAEAASLERTVAALSRTIDANRARLAEQTTALMAIGEGAAAKLSGVGTNIAQQVAVADERAQKLAAAASAAEAKLGPLLAALPRAHGETEALGRQLEQAGMTAGQRVAALATQLARLAEEGREADAIAGGAAQKLAAHLARMESTSETAGARLEAVTGDMAAMVDALFDRTASAVVEARKGIEQQGEAALAMLGDHQDSLDRVGRDSAEALAERVGAIDQLIGRIAARLGEQRKASDAIVTELDAGIIKISARLDALQAKGTERTQALAGAINALGGSADAMGETLQAGQAIAAGAIDTAERLLTALDAVAREIDETLPNALARLDDRIAESRQVVGDARPELLGLVTAAENTHDAITAIAGVIATQRDTLDALSGKLLETLNSGRSKADALGEMVEETIGHTNRFADEAAPRLVEALLRVRDTASAAAERARETLAAVIPEAAAALETASTAALRRASASTVEQQITALSEAGEAAAAAASRASERLTRQMLAIADSTAAVEGRIEEARVERENADQDTFARRVSLLIEALNSASIDIAKAFSIDVADSAWSAYLKGDRGVFTRRAVRLLDNSEAREIAKLYEDDPAFREKVNRYIHDFEAMLRAILAQRDGSPLGVTLLSSDMGKLYVAMAQAIERLRT